MNSPSDQPLQLCPKRRLPAGGYFLPVHKATHNLQTTLFRPNHNPPIKSRLRRFCTKNLPFWLNRPPSRNQKRTKKIRCDALLWCDKFEWFERDLEFLSSVESTSCFFFFSRVPQKKSSSVVWTIFSSRCTTSKTWLKLWKISKALKYRNAFSAPLFIPHFTHLSSRMVGRNSVMRWMRLCYMSQNVAQLFGMLVGIGIGLDESLDSNFNKVWSCGYVIDARQHFGEENSLRDERYQNGARLMNLVYTLFRKFWF